jgi:uncharacterized protein DUF3443
MRLAQRPRPSLAAATLLALLSACGGSGGSGGGSGGDTIGSPGPNVQPVAVNPGPAGDYVNGLFTSVTICVPGTSSCQTIDGVLVDTGSMGLRLVSSVVTLPLPGQPSAAGAALLECNQFQDSFQWGEVVRADVKIAGEQASAVPLQLVGGTDVPVPDACTSSGVPPQHTVDELGANGILGIGLFQQDCGPACALNGSRNPGIYYSCPGSGCVPTAVALDQQVQNPVSRFSQDNNGVIVQLPPVPAQGAPHVDGSLIFGIGTRSNNGLGSALVYRVDDVGNFTTVFQGQSYPASFVDSGSNGLYFLDSATAGLQTCRDSDSFYCPPATANLTATNRGANGTSAAVNFSVANAQQLFNTPNNAFSNLGGKNDGAFDWGLPFFYGRNVYTAIELSTTPGGSGPYFAY